MSKLLKETSMYGHDVKIYKAPLKTKKKYKAIIDDKKTVFFGGDPRKYEQYHDRIGAYSNLDHKDLKRR